MERSRTRKLITSLVMATIVIGYALPTWSCGPFFEQAIFSYSDHPDFPLSKFAAGELGIIQPTYARSYLIAAYRYLIGKPLNSTEQKAFLDLWQKRLSQGDQYPDQYSDSDQLKAWLKLRGQVVGGAAPHIDTYRNISSDPNTYNNFLNCPPETFSGATQTLNELLTKYGTGSNNVKEWVSGQDKVFCHCGGPKYDYNTKTMAPEGAFPEALAANNDTTLIADRTYQIAAADFYAMQYDKAASEFEAIAKDDHSPWKSVALYMAARCLTRKGTIAEPIDREALSKASQLLEAILQDAKQSALHTDASGLLEYIQGKTDPEKRLLSLASNMFEPDKQSVLSQSLYDYTFLLDNYFPDPDGDAKTAHQSVPQALRQNDLTDWLAAFQDDSDKSQSNAQEKWQKTHSLPWLLATLQHAKSKEQIDQQLLSAAEAIEPSSPAYASVRLQLIRLLVAANQTAEAKAMLAKMMAENLSPSTKNSFAYYQMLLAPALADFVTLAVRHPAAYNYDASPDTPDDMQKVFALKDYPVEKRTCFVPDGAYVLNSYTPLDNLKRVSLATTISGEPRFDLAQAAWTRAVLLKQYALAQDLVPLLKKLRPQLASLYDAFVNAPTPLDKQFAAYFLILRNPGSRPYVTQGTPREVEYNTLEDYGDNWWSTKGFTSNGHVEDTTTQPIKAPAFLSLAEQKTASAQIAAIKALGEAPNLLTAAVLEYAHTHVSDARIPEALYRCVRATKLGSTDSKTVSYSRQAFTLLHKQYSNSTWTKQTPYYYGG